ncbi:MAG: glycosyltransferase [Syntrophaceae bacterium]|nr:glycosyltransferase [Syntrophaceae bacterium]
MNICIITSSFPSHRDDLVQAPFVGNFIEGLKARGHHVFIFTQDRQGKKEEFLKDVKVIWFTWMTSPKPMVELNPLNPLDLIHILSLFYHGKRALLPFLRENRIDACLGLWVLPGGYFANYAYRKIGIPYSIWALGSDIQRYGGNFLLYRVMRRIVQEATGVFADGFDLAKGVEERFKKKCFFLATTRTLSSPLFLKKEEPGKSGEGPYRFLFVGRLEKVKGIDLLLESAALLKEEGIRFHLTVVGNGSLGAMARDFVDRKGLGDWVTLTGNISDERLVSMYTASDCVVIPSRSESIPLVFSEALNFNKEMIVADVGDLGMLGRTYGVAWVVPPEDVRALKEMMKKIVETGDRRRREVAGEGRREELKRLFNIETSVERFLADYL